MSDSKDVAGFGKRLHDLREKRYKELPSKYPYCKTQQVFCDAIASRESDDSKYIRRQTLASWESGQSYPSISRLLILCELLDCEPSYLLGYGKTINQENEAVSQITGLELKSVEALKGNKPLINFLNYLLANTGTKFIELIDFITKESGYYYLDNDLLMHYKPTLKKMMEKAFSRSFGRPYAYDDPLTEYKRELKRETRDLYESRGEDGILEYISEDVQNQIRQAKNERHIPDHSEESYNLILDFLVKFSYQPLSHMNEKEQNLGRILQMFADLMKGFFNNVIPKTKKGIKAYATAKSQGLKPK